VRVVAATHRDLHAEINAQRFRQDLYYRFASVTIRMPALRERLDDLPDLILEFLTDLGDAAAMTRLDRPSFERLMRHDWPGNVRELRNVIMAAHAQSEGGPLEVGDLLAPPGTARPLTGRRQRDLPFQEQKRELVAAFEREFLAELMAHAGGNISEMSRRSGLPRMTLSDLLKRYGFHSPK
jgi:DNA-binding NtrC family response regulator